MNKNEKRPQWGIRVKQELVVRNMTVAQLARDLGYSRPWLSLVINGSEKSDEAKDRIYKYLNLN